MGANKSAKHPPSLISEGGGATSEQVRLKTRAPKQPRPQSFLKDLDIGHGMMKNQKL
jgi:hypothetical protein